MKNIIPFPPEKTRNDFAGDADPREEAAAWLARIDRGDLAPEEAASLKAWLDRDRHNREAMRELEGLWSEMDRLSVLAELFPLPAEPAAVKPAPKRRWHTRAIAAAATAVIAIGLTLAVLKGGDGAPLSDEPTELVYETGVGQQSRAALKDGSVITLNTHSRVRVQFSEGERAVHLVAGEAHFEVEKEVARPFVVYAAGGSVRAVGTAFSVRLVNGRADVVVSEGVVEVKAEQPEPSASADKAPGTPSQSITLAEGGSARYGERAIETVAQLPAKAIENQLAWRRGKWIFEGETLAEVVAEVNRYTDRRIEIADPRIANLRVGGYFDVGDIEPLLAALEAGFGIKVTRVEEDLIQLSAMDGDTVEAN